MVPSTTKILKKDHHQSFNVCCCCCFCTDLCRWSAHNLSINKNVIFVCVCECVCVCEKMRTDKAKREDLLRNHLWRYSFLWWWYVFLQSLNFLIWFCCLCFVDFHLEIMCASLNSDCVINNLCVVAIKDELMNQD